MTALDRLIGLDEPDAWRAAIEQVPHGFCHTWECCNAIHATTGYPTYLYVHQRDSVRIACVYAERDWGSHTDIVTPFGLSGFTANGHLPGFPGHWRQFCRDKHYVCAYLALHPVLDDPQHHGPSYTSNTLFVMDLRPGADALLKNVNRERRRVIRRWRESGREFTRDRHRLTGFLLEHHEPFMRAVGAQNSARLNQETLRRFCAAPQVEMIGIEDAGEVVCLLAWAQTPFDAECLFFLALPDGRKYMPILTWAAIEHCASSGIPFLNLGGGVTADDSIAFAKKLFNPVAVPLRSLKEVFDDATYQQLCAQEHVDPADNAGYFPAYRRARPTAADAGPE